MQNSEYNISTWYITIPGANMVCGGERRSHALAQIDAWEKIICFFNDRLR